MTAARVVLRVHKLVLLIKANSIQFFNLFFKMDVCQVCEFFYEDGRYVVTLARKAKTDGAIEHEVIGCITP